MKTIIITCVAFITLFLTACTHPVYRDNCTYLIVTKEKSGDFNMYFVQENCGSNHLFGSFWFYSKQEFELGDKIEFKKQ